MNSSVFKWFILWFLQWVKLWIFTFKQVQIRDPWTVDKVNSWFSQWVQFWIFKKSGYFFKYANKLIHFASYVRKFKRYELYILYTLRRIDGWKPQNWNNQNKDFEPIFLIVWKMFHFCKNQEFNSFIYKLWTATISCE